MDFRLETIAPVAGALLYLTLLGFLRGRRADTPGVQQFELMLVLLLLSSFGSAVWHSTYQSLLRDWVLRGVTWTDLAVAPALLAFVVTRHPTRLSRALRQMAFMLGLAVGVVALFGSMNRAILTPVGAPSRLDQAIAYGAVLVSLATYIGACSYLVSRLAVQRDPFERNHLKFLTLAALLILLGQLTNLVPALQRFPIDRTLAATSCGLVLFSMVRYRLFDADVILKRGLVDAASLSVVAPIYLLALFRLVGGGELTTAGLAFGLGLLVPAALAFHFVRTRIQRAIDRLLVTRHVDREQAMSRFASGARTASSRREVAGLLADICQGSLDCRYASVLLVSPDSGALETAETRGAFAGIRPVTSIALSNPILEGLAQRTTPATPLELQQLMREARSEDRDPFLSLERCILQPIVAADGILGLIAIADPLYQRSYSMHDLTLMRDIADQAVLALESVHLLEQAHARANTDFLTGLPNHRSLQDLLDRTIEESPEESPFAVAMIDVDNFKLLNDTRGHIAGDEALRTIASFLRSSVGSECIVGRYGGDEFLVILPETDRTKGEELLTLIARRARQMTLTVGAESADGESIPMRLSWGVSAFPEDGRSARLLVGAADSELLRRRYMRRRAGQVNANRPSLRGLGETDPRRVRLASGLLDLLDAKDPYTTEHSQQVASLALLLGEELGLSEPDRHMLWLGGLLHDVGKLTVPEEVIRKPGSLSDADWAEIRRHPTEGRLLIAGLFDDPRLAEIVECHHERYDGKGYPRGLQGEAIPYLARAISVADSFSAMVHDRPYRKGLLPAEAVSRLQEGAGVQWDEGIVAAFVRAVTGAREQAISGEPVASASALHA